MKLRRRIVVEMTNNTAGTSGAPWPFFAEALNFYRGRVTFRQLGRCCFLRPTPIDMVEETDLMLPLSTRYLLLENAAHRGTGGVSTENRALGFQPAFQDTHTGIVYLATFADGRPAPFHVLDGLPEEVVVARDRRGTVSQVLGSIVAGFLRNGTFYTREQAAAAVVELELPETA